MTSIHGLRVTGTHIASPVKIGDVITGITRSGRLDKVSSRKDFLRVKVNLLSNLKGWPRTVHIVRGNVSTSVEITRNEFLFLQGEDAKLQPVYRKGHIDLVDTKRSTDKVDLEETQELDPLVLPTDFETRLDLEALYGKGAGDFDGEFSTVDMESVAFRRLNKCDVWEDNSQKSPPPTNTEAAAKFRKKLGKMLAPKVKEIERRRPTLGPKNKNDDNLLWTLVILFALLYFFVIGASLSSGVSNEAQYVPTKRSPSTYSRPRRVPDYSSGFR